MNMPAIKLNAKSFFFDLKNGLKKSNTAGLAAASSFYFILTFIPFLLLVTRTVGLFMGQKGERFDEIIIYMTQFVPAHLDGIFSIIADIVKKSMFYSSSLSLINFIFLVLSSLGFVNSIWQALEQITLGKHKFSRIKNSFKGLLILFITSTFFVFLFLIPVALNFLASMIASLDILRFGDFFSLKEYILKMNSWAQSANIFSMLSLVVFIFLIFKIILHKVVNLRSILVGTIFFIGTLMTMKSLFFFYVSIVKNGLVTNYGTMYAAVLFLVWIQASLYSFYLSMQISLSLKRTVFVEN